MATQEEINAKYLKKYAPKDEMIPVNVQGFQNPENLMESSKASSYGSTFGKKLAEQEFKPEERRKFYEEKLLSDDRVKKLLSNIGALQMLPGIERQAESAPIGPISGKIFDASVSRVGENGEEIPPDFIDTIITKLASKKTGDIRKLDELLSQLKKRYFDTGGKALTGTEVKIQSAEIPSYYQEPSQFKQTIDTFGENISSENKRIINQLKMIGYPEEVIQKLLESR
ncbi:MAG: hypothetical protein SFW66_08905 [Gammaproteobacteria bacterium]|nr:hypothetical protein [Gammaproteobacteria bacterium]